MAFIGTPLDTRNTFQSLQGKRFNGDGSETDFTLDVAPSSVLDIEVFVGNVRQDPNSAYTLSGTTLTFTGAPPSGTNNIYVVHQAKSVGTIDPPATESTAKTFSGGVTLSGTTTHSGALNVTGGLDSRGGAVFNEGSADEDFRVETNGQTHALFVNGASDGKVSINESASDTGDGGLCLNQTSDDTFIFTLKSNDVAHGITGHAETDTYGTFRKIDGNDGGLQIHGLGEDAQAVRINGIATTVNTAKSNASSTLAPIILEAALKSGTGSGDVSANGNLLVVKQNGGSKFLVDEDGDIHYDGADQGAFDTYEDAQLVRSLDLSHGKGVIDSKFDDYVEYNHETLANAKLVGREEDGTPNHFINITGMQRLHNGAIWQQYEKHQQLLEAVYDLAKEAVGEEKANAILEKHEVKRLN